MRKSAVAALFLSVGVLCSCSLPMVTQTPLRMVPTKVGTLQPQRPTSITVVVHDARAVPAALGGLTAPSASDRVLRFFAESKPGEVAGAFRVAATEAAQSLGFPKGTDLTLEVSIQKFYVDMYRFSGYSTANCIGYGEIETVLKSSDGATLRKRSSRVAYWEDTTPVGSFDEVAEEALSRIYAQAAWETTVRILNEQFPPEPVEAALDNILRTAQGTGDEIDRREAVFWLGLVGQGNPAVEKTLLELFRAAKEQNVAEGAAESIGMLDLKSTREELQAVLAGTRKLHIWDVADAECAWYLLKALSLLGTPDLEARIPAGIRMRDKLTDLVQFLEAETFPALTPQQKRDIDNGLLKLKP